MKLVAIKKIIPTVSTSGFPKWLKIIPFLYGWIMLKKNRKDVHKNSVKWLNSLLDLILILSAKINEKGI